MKIWLLLVAAFSAYAIKDPPESNRLLYGGENYPTDALHRTSAAASFRRRFNRNAGGGDLATHVNYLQMMARITNGIHILKSGMDKSLDSDQFISEILHFGVVTPAQIIAIDSSTVQEAKNRLENLPDDMKATKEEENVEKLFAGLKKILAEIDGIGNIIEWKDGKEHFMNETRRLAENGVPMEVLNDMDAYSSMWNNKYKKLEKNTPLSSSEIKEMETALDHIKTGISNFTKSGPFWTFVNFTTALDGISPILKAANGVKVYREVYDDIVINKKKEESIGKFPDSAITKLNDSVGRFAEFQTIIKLMMGRSEKNSQKPLKLTPGLFNGAPDFSRLFADVLDPWILKVVKTKSLKTAINNLEEISDLLNNMDNSLGTGSHRLQELVDFQDSLSAMLLDINDAKSGFSQGHNCSIIGANPITLDSFENFYKTLEEIDKTLAELKNETDSLSVLVATSGIIQVYDEAIAIFKEVGGDDTKVNAVLEKFRNYTKRSELNSHVVHISEFTNRIELLNPGTIKNLAKTANDNMIALDDYHKQFDHYAEYFVCLQKQDKLKSVFNVLDGLDRIRKWNNDKKYSGALTDGINTMNKVIGIKGDLEALQKSIGSLGDLKTKETDALKDFKDAPTISQNIGKAVQGLAEMSLALEKRADVEKKFDDIKVVSDNKANVKDPGDLDSLNKLVSLPGTLQKMYTSLGDFDKTVGSFVRSDTFANQSGIFEKAKQVSGVTGDFSRMSVAVGNLKQTAVGGDADKLKEIEDALKTMDSLDLNFAGFHKDFNESKKSLEELDVFFAGFFAKFQPISATIAPGQTQPTGSPYVTVLIQRPWTSTQGGEDGTSDFVLYGSIAGGVILSLVFVVLLHLCLYIWCHKCLVDNYWFKCIKWEPTPEMLIEYFNDFCYDHYCGLSDDIEYNRENVGLLTYFFYTKFYETDKTKVYEVDPGEIRVTDCRFSKPFSNIGKAVLDGCRNRFDNLFLHATKFDFSNRYFFTEIWWFTQAPQKKSAGKNSTIEKLFWLAKQEKTQSMVMLCALEENGATLCDRYYPEKEGESMEFDKLIVKCSKVDTLFDQALQVRTLDVKFDTEKQFSLTHYALKNWPENGYPTDLAPLIYLYNKLQKDKHPAIVHCSDGCKRTGPFGLAAIAYKLLFNERTDEFLRAALVRMRIVRIGSIETPKDYAFGGRLCLEILAKKAKLNDKQKGKYEDLKFGWENYENGKVQYERMREKTTAKSSTTKI
ncbi:hypothetical protein CRE_23509 [Caenorhabditis remanei]|uniref:Tyrosine-protein phosphatase domain-containing protein n=1 Tax=Caenorhabditis remanei TaxID=31234 RepID=E3MH37_CAERE|nr:hypothetical protein CRE_23509 [Caenorhabditis remanei]